MESVETETKRRGSVWIWIALLVSVGLYALLLVTSRSRNGIPSNPDNPRNDSIFWMLLAIGAVQFCVLWWVAGRKLRGTTGTPVVRARAFFLLRATSAEVLMLYGLMFGFQRRPIHEPLVFFAAALAGFALCFPSREAWADAVQIAENTAP